MEPKPNVLIVDDEKMNLDVLVDLLNPYYRTIIAKSGSQAIARLKKQAIDLVLLDIMMPEMDGYDVCTLIKNDSGLKTIPVIFISALDEILDKVKAFSCGGVDYITKPFVEAEVLARIKTHLNLRLQQREITEQRERFQMLSESAFEGVVIYENREILEVNQAITQILGYDRNALLNQNLSDIIPPASRTLFENHVKEELGYPCELQLKKQDGALIPVEVQTRNKKWENRTLRILAVRDLSFQAIFSIEEKMLNITLGDQYYFGKLVGKSPAMKKVYENILRAAATDYPLVLYGETGTGKELTARTVGEMCQHHNKSFVAVNCAAITESLFESQFFGYKKGAFTDAKQDHDGFFKQAHGGTLFLDELGELPLTIQAKFLRVLEDMTYRPIGSKKDERADVRIITATNRDLKVLVDQGKLRSDLYHRLYVLNIDLPPLRFRKTDIPLLVSHFVNLEKKTGRIPDQFSIPEEIINRFTAYDWPGNVRELLNKVRKFLAIGELDLSETAPSLHPVNEGDAGSGTAPADFHGIPADLTLTDAIDQFEQYYVSMALEKEGGHKSKAAKALKVDRKTLYRKLKKWGLE